MTVEELMKYAEALGLNFVSVEEVRAANDALEKHLESLVGHDGAIAGSLLFRLRRATQTAEDQKDRGLHHQHRFQFLEDCAKGS